MSISRRMRVPAVTYWDLMVIYKRTTQTGIKRWQVHVMRKLSLREITKSVHWRPMSHIMGLMLLMLFLSCSSASAQGSSWEVGRAVISGGEAGSGLSLKISLRNAGAPSSESVRVLGRWTGSGPGKKSISGSDLGTFVELGLFTMEVKMKQTAILDMGLRPLGAIPAGMRGLELAIITGKSITDGVVVLKEE